MQGARIIDAERQGSGESSSHAVARFPNETAIAALSAQEQSEFALGCLIHDGAFSARLEDLRSRSLTLLLTLRAQVTRVAALTAICATAANVLRNAPDLRAARALTHFYPVGPANFILASTRLFRLDPNGAVASALGAFNDALDSAMIATVQYTDARQATLNLAKIPTLDLCANWRTACAKAHRLLFAIDDAIDVFHPLGRADDGDVLVSVLKEAASGGIPLREPNGEFVMPAWVEQRQSPRIAVACSARLINGACEAAIRITDVSTGGLGIEAPALLSEGEIVTIDVGGMVLPGRVIWYRAGRAGIAFEQRLLDDSPEFRFLAGHAENR